MLSDTNNLREIRNITGCIKPCNYKEYKIINSFTTTMKLDEHNCWVTFTSVAPDTRVQTEVILYPVTSYVAEFGGTLGLFLGFSFMSLWDGVEATVSAVKWIRRYWMSV